MFKTQKFIGYLFLATLFAFNACNSKSSAGIKDIIQPLNLIAGVSDTIIVDDLFYSENYDLNFNSNENVKAEYFKASKKLVLRPDENFEGITLVSFQLEGETYQIPLKVRIVEEVKFTFEPGDKYEFVSLFGSFNGWNRKTLPMTDENNDGVYEIEIPIEPGRYEYKFFADGSEFLDTQNPESVSNGMGGFNSVLIIEPRHTELTYLHFESLKEASNKLEISYHFESPYFDEQINKSEVIALNNNKLISGDNISINKNSLTFILSEDQLAGEHQLRFAVSKNGNPTNIINLFIKDGKPASSANQIAWYDAVIYSMMIDRFNDGDKSLNAPIQKDSLFKPANYMGGDLQGIIDKIDDGYFTDLGVNVFWISPVYDNPNEAYREYPPPHRWYTGYHGYWPISHTKVEEKFGTIEKVKELVKKAHQNGIKVLLDFVSNHVHEQHPLFKEHRDWFGKLDLPDGRKNLRFWDEYRLTTWFEPYLPSFDFLGAPQAIDYLTDNAIWWLKETGADGFRHDAVKHVPNEFWRALTAKLKKEIGIPQDKVIYQIGETFGGYDLISSYVNNGQLSSQFNFNLFDTALRVFIEPNGSFKNLNAEMMQTFNVYGVNHLMGNVMDSHDKVRFMAYADGDISINESMNGEIGWNNPPKVDNPENYKLLELYYAYMFTIPGLPVVYYGSEFGITGANDPDNRRMMRFGNDISEEEAEVLSKSSAIIKMRNEHPALVYGDYYSLAADENIYSYLRSDPSERLIVVLNKSKEPQRVDLRLPSFYEYQTAEDLNSKESFPIEREALTIVVEGVGWRVLKLK